MIAAPIVSELMTNQVGLARRTEPGFAKSIANIRATDRVKVGHSDGAASKIAPGEHLDQISLNTLLLANPMASNLTQEITGVVGAVRVIGVASNDERGDGVGHIDFGFVVETVDVVDVRVDFGFRIPAVVLIELVVHIASQLAFIEQPAEES